MTLLPECEPFLIALKDTMPQFAPKFRGYQMDKVSHSQHLGVLGTRFTAHPRLFIVHLPHSKSFNIDSALRLKMPARHDQWTALRVALAITVGDAAEAKALEDELAAGTAEPLARERARKAGETHLLHITDYFESYLPPVDWHGMSTAVVWPAAPA